MYGELVEGGIAGAKNEWARSMRESSEAPGDRGDGTRCVPVTHRANWGDNGEGDGGEKRVQAEGFPHVLSLQIQWCIRKASRLGVGEWVESLCVLGCGWM